MKVSLSRRFRHIALNCLVASITGVITLAASNTVPAEEVPCGGEFQLCNETLSSCQFELHQAAQRVAVIERECEQELCGWATHDSCPIAVTRVATRTSSSFDTSIAAAAATACASVGISVEQIVEPFAMVGPQVVNSYQKVKQFQDWWRKTTETSIEAQQQDDDVADEIAQSVPESQDPVIKADPGMIADREALAGDGETDRRQVELQSRINTLAKEEPIDISLYGPSVLVVEEEVSDERPPAPVNISDAALSQVGASAVIVSIEESYLPYDLSANDLRLWSVFPLVTEPFCIRSRFESETVSPRWDQRDDAVAREPSAVATEPSAVATEPSASDSGDLATVEPAAASDSNPDDQSTLTTLGSADCLLDELIWNLDLALDRDSALQRWFTPRIYGQYLATFVIGSGRVAESAAARLAIVWPRSPEKKRLQKQTAGDQLLARAGAIEASSPIDGLVVDESLPLEDESLSLDDVRIADAPIGSSLR